MKLYTPSNPGRRAGNSPSLTSASIAGHVNAIPTVPIIASPTTSHHAFAKPHATKTASIVPIPNRTAEKYPNLCAYWPPQYEPAA